MCFEVDREPDGAVPCRSNPLRFAARPERRVGLEDLGIDPEGEDLVTEHSARRGGGAASVLGGPVNTSVLWVRTGCGSGRREVRRRIGLVEVVRRSRVRASEEVDGRRGPDPGGPLNDQKNGEGERRKRLTGDAPHGPRPWPHADGWRLGSRTYGRSFRPWDPRKGPVRGRSPLLSPESGSSGSCRRVLRPAPNREGQRRGAGRPRPNRSGRGLGSVEPEGCRSRKPPKGTPVRARGPASKQAGDRSPTCPDERPTRARRASRSRPSGAPSDGRVLAEAGTRCPRSCAPRSA